MIIIKLVELQGARLISRSQAKRIVRNLEKFKHVLLDFKGVEFVGQGFADQIFRVFHNEYPDIEINYTNANDDIKFMIERAKLV